MKLKVILLLCVLLFLLVQAVQAMSSANYRVDWTNQLTGSGGSTSSPGFKMNFTVGQTVSGAASSPNFKVQWGYWSAVGPGAHTVTIYLPKINKIP